MQVASGPRHYDNWRADPAMAGLGSVHNVGVHGLDFLRVLLHSEPMEMAMFDRAPGRVMSRCCLASYSCGSRMALVQYNANETLRDPAQRHRDLWDLGSSGGQVVHPIRSDGEAGDPHRGGRDDQRHPAPEAHRLSLAAFTNAVLMGRSRTHPPGRAAQRSGICEAIERSARSSGWVEWLIEAPVTEAPGFDDVVTIDQVIARARELIDPGAYVGSAGAGQGVTTARNTLALNRLALVPRVLRDVSTVDTTSSFVGVPLAIPVLLAPWRPRVVRP